MTVVAPLRRFANLLCSTRWKRTMHQPKTKIESHGHGLKVCRKFPPETLAAMPRIRNQKQERTNE